MGKSLHEIWEKLQLESQDKKEKELQKERELFEIREKLRQQYLERNRIYEKVALTNTSPSSSAGGGSLSSTPPIEPTYWALIFDQDSGGQSYTPQSMDRDSSGNIYSASIYRSNPQQSIIRKISSTGTVIWEKVLLNGGSAGMEVCRIVVVPDNGVIILYKGAIRKLDDDGNLIWSFLQDAINPTEFTACCLDEPNDNESIYVVGISDGQAFQIAEFDTNFGTRLNNKEISILGGVSNITSYSDMVMNGAGNLIVGLSWATVPPNYHTTIIEIEKSTLGSSVNILNQWDLDPSEYDSMSSPQPNRQDITSLAIDSNSNIITHGYERGLTLITSDFSTGLGIILDIVLNSEAWDSTSLAIPNGSSGDVFVVGEDGPNVIKIVKLSSFVTEFSYTIESAIGADLTLEGWNSTANSSINIVDGAMLITCGYSNGPFKEMLLKLPLTNMSGYPDTASRTLGDFIFTNSPIVQNNLFTNTTPQNFSTGNSTWLSNDAGLSLSFSEPNNIQSENRTSLD